MSDVQPLIDIREDATFLDDKRQIEAAELYARRFATQPITSQQEAGEVADAIKGLSGSIKTAEGHAEDAGRPYHRTHRAINAAYKELLSTPRAAIQALKDRVLAFKSSEEQRVKKEQREEQERLDREAEEKAKEAQAAAELLAENPADADARELVAETHEEAARAAVAVAPKREAAKQIRGDFAVLGSRIIYEHEVIDFSQLPDSHKQVNDRSIKAAIKAERESAKAQQRPFDLNCIPGVRITSKDPGVIR